MRISREHSLNGGVVIAGLRQQLEADLRLTLPFGSSVLVPSFDLGIGERQRCGQVHSILNAEIFLTFETSFQLLQLMVGERRSGFARLFSLATAAVVVVVKRGEIHLGAGSVVAAAVAVVSAAVSAASAASG